MTAKIKKIHSKQGPVRVVIYVRVSSRNQDIENSAEAQIAECTAYIKKMGWVLVGIYIDKAKSGRSDVRPQHSLMIHDGTRPDREFDKVIVWKMDRYARNETHASLTKAMLRKNDVDVVSITEPGTEGQLGRVMEVLIDTMAEIVSEGIAENVKRGTRHLARQGYYPGAVAPYGYKIKKELVGDREHQKLEIDPETSWVVRLGFDHVFAGKSINYIIRDFYIKGIPSPTGLAIWPQSTVGRMIRNPAHAGTIVWSSDTEDDDGMVIYPNAHPGIVTNEELEKAGRMLTARYYQPKEEGQYNNPRELGSPYPFSGIITCICGGKLQPKPAKSGKYAYYTCQDQERPRPKKVCNCPNWNSGGTRSDGNEKKSGRTSCQMPTSTN